MATIGAGIFGTLVVMAAVLVTAGAADNVQVPGFLLSGGATRYGVASFVLALLGFGLCLSGRSRSPGYFGMRWPRRFDFLLILPGASLVAVAGASWAPLRPFTGGESPGVGQAATIVIGVIGIELLLRGALHGLLVTVYPIMLSGGRHFISVPNAVSAVTYAALVGVCFMAPSWLPSAAGGALVWLGWLGAAFAFGLICGGVRERWGSVWTAVILHALTALAAWAMVVKFG